MIFLLSVRNWGFWRDLYYYTLSFITWRCLIIALNAMTNLAPLVTGVMAYCPSGNYECCRCYKLHANTGTLPFISYGGSSIILIGRLESY